MFLLFRPLTIDVLNCVSISSGRARPENQVLPSRELALLFSDEFGPGEMPSGVLLLMISCYESQYPPPCRPWVA